MAPTLTASYAVHDTAVNATAIVTSSFTPANGEVLVVKGTTWDSAANYGAGPVGGSQTYTKQVEAAPGGFSAYAVIWTAVVSGSPGAMTVSMTPSASSRHSMVVERWSSAQLAGTPASNATKFGNATTPSTTLTSTGTGSIVSWCLADANSRSPTGRTYLSSATEEDVYDLSGPADGVWYYAYQSAAAAGSQTFGLSSPTANLIWSMVGIEVQDGGAPAAPPPQPPQVRPSLAALQRANW